MTFLRNILSIAIITLLVYACSNDDSLDGLRYKNSKYAKFEVYVGSAENNGQLVKVKMDSIRYFNPIVESFTDGMISFERGQIFIVQLDILESSPYKFENEALYIYNDGLWEYFGYGNTNAITIRQHYIAYRENGGKIQRLKALPQENFTVEEAITRTPFGSLSGMKNKGDTLVICTRDSYFK